LLAFEKNPTMNFKKSKKPILGVGWYRKDQWDLLKKKSEDANDLENTYYEWVANANDSIKTLSKSIHRIEKIDIDVNELIDWCKNEGCKINGESRANFISLKTKDKFS
jgi:hypothetical protein